MSKKYLSTIKDFSLGLNDKDAPNLIPDNALVDVENAVLGRGLVSKRHGYQEHALTPAIRRVLNWSDIGEKKWSDL